MSAEEAVSLYRREDGRRHDEMKTVAILCCLFALVWDLAVKDPPVKHLVPMRRAWVENGVVYMDYENMNFDGTLK
jgi:hypothetical protein